MKKNAMRIFALLLALCMMSAIFAGCNPKTPETTNPTEAPTDGPTEAPTEAPTENTDKRDTLVVAYDPFSSKFSPFFATTAYDQDVTTMVNIPLLSSDRLGEIIYNGLEGETKSYNGTDYFYDGMADLKVTENEDGTTDYDFTLREGVVFSDGTPLTIDDVIFNMYVYADPTYDGAATFYALPIEGMEEYRAGMTAKKDLILNAGRDNTDFTNFTEEEATAYWTAIDEAGLKFAQDIIDFVVGKYAESQFAAVGAESADALTDGQKVALGMALWGYGEVSEDFTTVTGAKTGSEYAMDAVTANDYWTELQAAVGEDKDYGSLAEMSATELANTDLFDFVKEILGDAVATYDVGVATAESVPNISGIIKTGDNTLRVRTTKFDAVTIYQLAVAIAPMHYYGDTSLYDYDNNSFGFVKGDLSSVRAKTTQPLGAGPYKFVSFENGTITFEANENYFKGCPKTKYILFRETTSGDKLTGVAQGTFDIANPAYSLKDAANIASYNTDTNEVTGNVITTAAVNNLGYGYIGLNAKTMNVGGDADSDASKNMRKAFATMISVYRDAAISSYYGETASVINYPISSTSWAAPTPSDEGYEIAFSKDVDGNPIYTDGMSEQEKEEAALNAARGFLKAAGFTIDEATGKCTAAPDGAKLNYEIIVPADGKGDHPVFALCTNLKNGLEKLGITLNINDPQDSNILWDALDAETEELWCAAWGATVDPDMYQVYHSSNIVGKPGATGSNHYHIEDAELDELMMEARSSADQTFRKAAYKDCLNIILDWGCEVPVYQRENCFIFSTERVNISTLTPDITTFWTWMNDLELLEMN